MKKIGRILVLGCLIVVSCTFVALADAKKAASQAHAAADYALKAYEYAQKASYNSTGKARRYCLLAMDAAKNAENAAKSVVAELESEEKKEEKK